MIEHKPSNMSATFDMLLEEFKTEIDFANSFGVT